MDRLQPLRGPMDHRRGDHRGRRAVPDRGQVPGRVPAPVAVRVHAGEGVSRESYRSPPTSSQAGRPVRPPTLWMALNYLRRANPAVYAREFDTLWNRADLAATSSACSSTFCRRWSSPRRGLGTVEDDRRLHDASWPRKALTAVTGKTVWFRLLAGSHLSGRNAEVARRGMGRRGGSHRRVRVRSRPVPPTYGGQLAPGRTQKPARLADTHLLDDWNKRAAELAVAVVRRTAVDQGGMWPSPRRSRRASRPSQSGWWPHGSTRRDVRIVSGGGGRAEDPTDQLRQLLDSDGPGGRHREVGGTGPGELARSLWPVVRDIATHLRASPSDYVIRYADDRLWFARLDRREYVAFDSPNQFFMAFDAAMRESLDRQREPATGRSREPRLQAASAARAVGPEELHHRAAAAWRF